MPQHHHLAQVDLQSRRGIPADRRPRDHCVRRLPHQQQLHDRAEGLLLGCHKADYTGTKNPNHAQAGFPTDCQVCHSTTLVGRRGLRPQQDGIPADRRARDRGLRHLPRQQQLQDVADGLLRLPPEGLHRHEGPEPRAVRVPDDVQRLPQHDFAGRTRNSTTTRRRSR